MQALFDAVREACSSRAWSGGAELSRAGAVIGERTEPDEIGLKVALQVGTAYATVTLWPADEHWSCDCRSSETACVHVPAAVIALRHARQTGSGTPAP